MERGSFVVLGNAPASEALSAKTIARFEFQDHSTQNKKPLWGEWAKFVTFHNGVTQAKL